MKSLLALLVLLATHAAAEDVISTKTNPADGHAYVLVRGDDPERGISWADANEFAKSLGGHLVVINDEAERQWLIKSFPAQGLRLDHYYWIGLTDVDEEGNFEWVNGDPVEFTAWHAGFEPSDTGSREDYVQVYNFPNGAFQWNDMPNQTTFKGPEFRYPISAVIELPEGAKPPAVAKLSKLTAGHYRGPNGEGNPIDIFETGSDQFEIQTPHWKGIGFWDRKHNHYEGVYCYPGAGPGDYDVVGYHRFEPLGDGKFAVTTVGDFDLPRPTPFIIKRMKDGWLDGAPSVSERAAP